MSTKSVKKVSVESPALVSMMQHAASHKYETIHGLLLGKVSGDAIVAENAVAVCHGTPTRPIVEIAIGLVQQKAENKIVGWYTAPALLNDTKPGPVALRMAASLDTAEFEPALLVLQNAALAACLKGEGKIDDVLLAFGKDDLGGQWVRPLNCTMKDSSSAMEQVKTGIANPIIDFVDHLEGDVSSPWISL